MRDENRLYDDVRLREFLIMDACSGGKSRIVLGKSLAAVKRRFGWHFLIQECPPAGDKNKSDSSITPAGSPSNVRAGSRAGPDRKAKVKGEL